MTHPTVPTPDDGARCPVIVPAQFWPILERTGTWLIASRADELKTGVDDGRSPRHVVDMLVQYLVVAIDARAEVIRAASEPEGTLTGATLDLVGANAVQTLHDEIAAMWGEDGGQDLRGLAEKTKIAADLDDLLALAEASS